jgi:hypothetical protein
MHRPSSSDANGANQRSGRYMDDLINDNDIDDGMATTN